MQSNDRSGAAQDRTRISEDSIRRHLIEQIARRSRTSPAAIDPDRPLEEFGLGSRDAVAVAGDLERMLGRSLPATLVWEYPTINKLSVALAAGGTARAGGAGTTSAPDTRPGTARDVPPPATAPDEPVAVIGIGCRFPGGDRDLTGPGDYWRFLTGAGDAVREVPEGRWDAFDDGSPEVGDLLARTTRLGGFLADVAAFDARFFGITPREAAVMDPQQRLVLEVAWEAFEHAGLAPAALRGSRTGVFVGVSAPEYAAFTASDPAALEAFTATGAALSIIANRLSYLLDLRGPSMIVDTACSSSLVSTHLAVQALRRGEADVALAGGVNLLLSPTITMTFDQAGGTAADGRCKAFDASADGMVRAEGCGAVVLKRLPDALRDGDRVLAVIRGSGVNSDGRSNGLVAPNSDAQKALLREVYAAAGIDTREVDYVEAHGTGTFLGDPIEAGALGEVLGAGRDAGAPLLLGSAKSNLGHMESAAGVAGLIKAVLALHHRTIPPSAHYEQPNPHIPFEDLRLSVVAEETPWPDRGHPARAGVSGFGFGGTNAHVVLEEAPPRKTADDPVAIRVFPLSDTSEDRVRDHARVLAAWLTDAGAKTDAETETGGANGGDGGVRLADLALTLHRRGGRGRARAAVAARDRAGLVDGLTALAEGRPHPAVVTGTALGAPGRPVWVFSGYGAQRPGMARRLLEEEPAFAEAVDDLDALFQEEGGPALWDLLEQGVVPAGPAATMPVLFAVQIGLARTLASYGVTPGAVIGHSMGEVPAAVVAGALTLEDGVKVICRRSRLLTRLVGGGAMAVLGASAEDVARLAADLPEVYAAVHSSPKQTVVTGDAAQIATVVERAEAEGRLARMVKAEGAGHSPQVDPLLPHLREALAEVGAERGRPLAAGIRLYTTALDDPRALHGEDARLDAAYWAANLREPVRLTGAVAAAAEDGFRTFVEVNAHPILAHGIGETLEGTGALVTHTLKRAPKGQETDDALTFHARLGALAVHGLPIAAPAGGDVIDVPPAPWRHERHWVDLSGRRSSGRDEHPLLGAHVELPGEDRHAWRADLGTATGRWPAGARVHGLPALPAAAFAEMALAAGAEALGLDARSVRVHSLWMERPLALAEHTIVTTTFAEDEQRVEIHARTPAGTWARLARADIADTGDAAGDGAPPVPSPSGAATTAPAEIAAAERGSRHYRLHPEVFDRCLAALSAEAETAGGPGLWLPETIGELRVHGPTHRGGRARAEVVRDGTDLVGAVRLTGPDGTVVAEATGIVLRRVERPDVPVPLADKLVEVVWDEAPAPGTAIGDGTFLLLAEDDDATAGAVAAGLVARGHRVVRHRLSEHPPDRHPPMTAEPPDAVVLLPPPGLVDERLVLTVAGVSRSLPDGPRLWVATRAALPVLPGEAGEPHQGFARALTRVLAFERAAQRATLVDADRPVDLVTELLGDGDAREVAWRGGTRHVARLVRAAPLPPGVPSVQTAAKGRHAEGSPPRPRRIVRRGGAYVITGGYGGIGLVTARLLAARGAGRIVLSGRSGPDADAEKVIARLREDGVDVGVVLGDIAEPGVAERLVRVACEGGARLRGVLHGAGAIDDRLIADLGAADLHRVWRAKVEGARRLSAATWDADLDWFVLHSSAAALLGSPGQAAYAAANAALDALAAYRRAHGRTGTTVNWGAWSQVGGAAGLDLAVIDPISPDEGAEALEALLAFDRPAAGVLRFDPAAALGLFPEIRRIPYFAALTEGAGTGADPGDWPGVAALADLDPAAARRAVAARVRFRIASVLGFDPERLDPAVPLTDLGLDSLVAVRIKSGVEHDLGLTVPASVLLQGASVNAFEEWAAGELGLSGTPAPPPSPSAASNAEAGYVMPRDDAERLAVRYFEDVLGLDRVGVTADFFADLGGAEHQADQVVALVAAELHREVTRGELFAVPTAEHVAGCLRAADEEAARRTVRPLKPSGGRPPIFIAHPAGGTTACYRQLTALLSADQPVYGLERFQDAPSVEERAARYAERLQEARPDGAFRLGGWSFGGVLAYETARRLAAAGREVELVVLFDAGLPLPVENESDSLARRFAAFADYINETYGLGVDLTYEELAGLDEEAQFALVMERAEALADHIPPAALTHQLTSHQDTRSLEAYRPGPYDGPVLLYRAPEETPWSVKDARYVLDGTNGFGGLCSALEVVTVPGTHHLNLLDPPGVEFMAAHLDARLAGADPLTTPRPTEEIHGSARFVR
ncbi:type I polyketide synthase [Actinomadura viridis]|uniref:Phthiocerol/phenolphthiocerol synthesis type-I polyketide synthase D n=1 Tax=Actinomadura viridis TaxID=58110 RepID=A0A931DR92_9ACTN|nr:type I polyketide synthase [Actinomadura viridis]MBG6092517.1 phthiocerol/phenolphthiocerol synthesis type-I polyketide synthase D [Actinomadura viridis]